MVTVYVEGQSLMVPGEVYPPIVQWREKLYALEPHTNGWYHEARCEQCLRTEAMEPAGPSPSAFTPPPVPLPPKLDLIEVAALQQRLEGYFARWKQWDQDRETWRIVANRSDAFNDLAWLFEQALRLAVACPAQAQRTEALVESLVYVPGTIERRPEWFGNYSEENAEEHRAKCRAALGILRKLFEELGVSSRF